MLDLQNHSLAYNNLHKQCISQHTCFMLYFKASGKKRSMLQKAASLCVFVTRLYTIQCVTLLHVTMSVWAFCPLKCRNWWTHCSLKSLQVLVCLVLEGMDGFPVTLTEAVCLGASLAFSGLFYYLYKKNKTTIKKLEVCIFLCNTLYLM